MEFTFLEVSRGRVDELESNEFETTLLEAVEDVSN